MTLNIQVQVAGSWRGRLKVWDQVLALALLLDAGEDHFGSRNVLLGVFQVFHQGVLVPHDTWGHGHTHTGTGGRWSEPDRWLTQGADICSIQGIWARISGQRSHNMDERTLSWLFPQFFKYRKLKLYFDNWFISRNIKNLYLTFCLKKKRKTMYVHVTFWLNHCFFFLVLY